MKRTLATGFLSAVLLVLVMTAWADTAKRGAPYATYSADVSADEGPLVESVYSQWGLDQVTWMQVGNAITPFIRAASGHIGNYVYCFGEQNSNVAQAYNITTQQWEASTPPLYGNCNWCGVTADDRIYIVGRYDGGYHNEVQRFTPTGGGPTGTWELMAPYPQTLCSITADWDGGNYIYAAGGSSTNSSAYRYDITANVWQPIASMPSPMRYAGGAFVNGKFYVMGGVQSGMANTNFQYDPATDTWSQRAPIPVAVYFGLFSFTYNETYVISVGGGGGYGSWPASRAVQLYDPITNTWIQETMLPLTVGCNTGIWVEGAGEVLSAGGYDGTNYHTDSYLGVNFPGGIPPGTLEGYVYEEMVPHVPIGDAIVAVFYNTCTTDSTGFYRIDRVPEGIREVTVSAFGYNSVTDSVVIVADSITTMDFYLTQPHIALNVSSIEIAIPVNFPHDEEFNISNSGNGELEYEIRIPSGGDDRPGSDPVRNGDWGVDDVDEPWVWATPDQGTVNPGGTQSITLSFLMPDTGEFGDYYQADLIVVNNTTNPQVILPIMVTISINIVNESEGTVPQEFVLYQNYPNPFNPSTKISYQVPGRSNVTINVYDVLGKRVERLVEGLVEAGTHEVQWDVGDLPSGMYFVRMTAGEYVRVRKMVLLR